MTNENTGTTRESTNSEASGRKRLERIAMAYAVIVVGCALWYWHAQVQSVLEILEMAYG